MLAEPFVRRAQPWLGTLVEIATLRESACLISGAFREIAAVHRAMSFHEETSDLARLRKAAPGEAVRVSAMTVAVLRAARDFHARSGGVFDVTVAAQLVDWGYLPRPQGWRGGEGGAEDIVLLDDAHVALRKPLLIDLGGIAKGYAVDRAVDYLIERGAETGLVNAGGDLRVFGEASFPVSIRAGDWSARSEAFELEDGALATSSNCASRMENAARLVAPHVGRDHAPALYDGSVSVFAPCAMHADALTKIALCDAALARDLAPAYDSQIFYS